MLLSPQLREALDAEADIAIVLDDDRKIVFLNRAWKQSVGAGPFAEQLLPVVLGARYVDFVSGPLRQYLDAAFDRAARLGPGVKSVWLHSECNTPELFRLLTTRISALWTEAEDRLIGYLLHSDLRVMGSLSDRYPLVEPSVDSWRDHNGFIVQCGCCRRVRVPGTTRWVMCLALLERTERDTSHGLCELCLETYYAEPPGASA